MPGGRIYSQRTQNRPGHIKNGTTASIGTAAFIVTAASSAGLGYLEVNVIYPYNVTSVPLG